MIGQSFLEPLSDQLQARIGALLQARQRISSMLRYVPPESLADWQALQNQQTSLENAVPQVTAAARRLGAGEISLTDGQAVLIFYAQLEVHVANVTRMEAATGVPGGTQEFLMLAALVGLGIVSVAVSARSIKDSFKGAKM